MSSKEKMVVLSYAPLFELGEQLTSNSESEIQSRFNNAVSGEANGCLWLLDDDNTPVALLSYDKAKEIADHVKVWADGEIMDRLHLYCFRHENLYIISLFPDLDAAIGRVVDNATKLGMNIDRDATEFVLIFDPLKFISGDGGFNRLLESGVPADKIKVGLISTECALACAEAKTVPDGSDFFVLGTFNVDKDVAKVMPYFQGCINGTDSQ